MLNKAPLPPLVLSGMATANPLGLGMARTSEELRQSRTGLRSNDFECGLNTWIGRIDRLEVEPVVPALSQFDCRNNRLAQIGLRQDGFEEAVAMARRTHGAERIAVLIGTTTSGILETELAYCRRQHDGALPNGLGYRYTHNLFSVADFVRRYLSLEGPAASVSTACSSSAKVFAKVARFIQAGICDAAVDIAELIPHQGSMVLLERVQSWDDGSMSVSPSGTAILRIPSRPARHRSWPPSSGAGRRRRRTGHPRWRL